MKLKISVILLLLIGLTSAMSYAKEQTNSALDIALKWQNSNTVPIMGDGGRVLFTWSDSQPHVVCAPLKICDIAMEPGEVIGTVTISDTARWIVEPARVGTGDSTVEHILLKPKNAGLSAVLWVGTNRREYHIELFSTEKEYMGKVGFIYEQNAHAGIGGMGKIELLPAPIVPAVHKATSVVEVVSGHEVLAQKLNFDYSISGPSVPWKPIRVYDDGVKTFVDLDPHSVSSRELPILLINDTQKIGTMVNYRYIDGRFIVDGLFDKASLVIGKGRKQKKIKIARQG